MGLFSKENCAFCNKTIGIFTKKAMNDKKYICKDCIKKCSAFIKIKNYDSEYIRNHIEYMKKQNELYEKEFKTLDNLHKIIPLPFSGIVFADDIAMFEVIDSKTIGKNFKELFRYDQIRSFQLYTNKNNSGEGKKYSEVGVRIFLYSKNSTDYENFNEIDKKIAHPYVDELTIVCSGGTSTTAGADLIIAHLNEMFGFVNNSVVGLAKDMIMGGNDNAYAEAANAFKSIKNALTNPEDAEEKMNELNESVDSHLSEKRAAYTQIADEVEKRVWNSL